MSPFLLLARFISLIGPLDVFIGLNGVRILSVIALLLVFASNIVTLVDDVRAVNRFMAQGKIVANDSDATNSTLTDPQNLDYIA